MPCHGSIAYTWSRMWTLASLHLLCSSLLQRSEGYVFIKAHPRHHKIPVSWSLDLDRTNWHRSPHLSHSAVKVEIHSNDPKKSIENVNDDSFFDGRTLVTLVAGQAALVPLSMVVAVAITHTPNYGLGAQFAFSGPALQTGALLAIPLGVWAAALDLVEDAVPALRDVTTATQRSILALLGGRFKPVLAVAVAIALGFAAGFGEEMMFRGIIQNSLYNIVPPAAAVAVSSVLFGLLHAVTPLYAALATLASLYFGWIYLNYNNLGVVVVCHALYDVGALLYAHWVVSRLSSIEQQRIANWRGPGS